MFCERRFQRRKVSPKENAVSKTGSRRSAAAGREQGVRPRIAGAWVAVGGCSFRRGQWDLWVLFSSALCQTEVAKRQIRLRPPREGQLKGAHVDQHDPGLGDTPPVLWTPQPPAATEDPEPCLPTEETTGSSLFRRAESSPRLGCPGSSPRRGFSGANGPQTKTK